MARQILQIVREDETVTDYVGITDDGVVMRVHKAHFMPGNRQVTCSYERPPSDPLWRGNIEDFTTDIVERLEAGEVIGNTLAPRPAPIVRRTRPAR